MSWTRLEAATVDPDLVEGLQARVADPLWLLARQWQTGELTGEDAANPLLVRVRAVSVRPRTARWARGGQVDLGDAVTPLEPLVEREPVRLGPAGVRVGVELGRLLVRALRHAGAPLEVVAALGEAFPVELPPDDGLDPVGWRRLSLLARGTPDARALERALADGSGAAEDLLAPLVTDPVARRRLVDLVARWRTVVAEAFSEPAGITAWDAERLEYAVEVEAPTPAGGTVTLTTADGYVGGRLDWCSFDVGSVEIPDDPDPQQPIVREAELLPMPLRFRGMPAARFWEFENATVWFGGIEAGPQDLARVVVAGYATVYGDDWYLVPLQVPVGTLTQVTGLTVLDDFGAVTEVPAAAAVDSRDAGAGPRAFRFFELGGDPFPERGRPPMLFVPATVVTADASRPLEDVALVRDEVANVAWAVERRVESPSGSSVDLGARLPGRLAPGSQARPALLEGADEPWTFRLGTAPPGNWVPLLPVRITQEGAGVPDGAIMFQRGRRPMPGAPGETTGARGEILTPARRLLLYEEEIPRSGVRVVRRWQSARDVAGRLHTWVGRRKGPGRGEGSSGVRFDVIDRAGAGAGADLDAPP